ncbi:MAG: N-acetyltransferase, partial [Candidatus Omnitrophica bacterium]|nr:N-acetyltransferase [Candidatus Omnitrophota bacterium]
AAILKQMLLNPKYHADLHPGNIMVNVAEKKIYFMDFGNTSNLSSSNQDLFIQLLAALDSGNSTAAIKILTTMKNAGPLDPGIATAIQGLVISNESPEVKLRQITALLDFPGEFAILFKVFETITYLTDSLSYAKKKSVFRSIILSRQLTWKHFFSKTTAAAMGAEMTGWFGAKRSETRQVSLQNEPHTIRAAKSEVRTNANSKDLTPNVRSEVRGDVANIGEILGEKLGLRVAEILVNRIDDAFLSGSDLNAALEKVLAENKSVLDFESGSAPIRQLLQDKLQQLQKSESVEPIDVLTLVAQLENQVDKTPQERALLFILKSVIPTQAQGDRATRFDKKTAVFLSNLQIYVEGIKEDFFNLIGISQGLQQAVDASVREDVLKVCPFSAGVLFYLAETLIIGDDRVRIVQATIKPTATAKNALHLWTEIVKSNGSGFYISLVDSQFSGFGFDKNLAEQTTGKINVFHFGNTQEREQILKEQGIDLSDFQIVKGSDRTLLRQNDMVQSFESFTPEHSELAAIIEAKAAGDELERGANISPNLKQYKWVNLIMAAVRFAYSKASADRIPGALALLKKAADFYESSGSQFTIDYEPISVALWQIAATQSGLKAQFLSDLLVTPHTFEVEVLQKLSRLTGAEASSVSSKLEMALNWLARTEEAVGRTEETTVQNAFLKVQQAERLIQDLVADPGNTEKKQAVRDFLGNDSESAKLIRFYLTSHVRDIDTVNSILTEINRSEMRQTSQQTSVLAEKDRLQNRFSEAVIDSREGFGSVLDVNKIVSPGNETVLKDIAKQIIEIYDVRFKEHRGEESFKRYFTEEFWLKSFTRSNVINLLLVNENGVVTGFLLGINPPLDFDLKNGFSVLDRMAKKKGVAKGAGTFLLDIYLERLRQLGVSKVMLTIGKGAQKFYQEDLGRRSRAHQIYDIPTSTAKDGQTLADVFDEERVSFKLASMVEDATVAGVPLGLKTLDSGRRDSEKWRSDITGSVPGTESGTGTLRSEVRQMPEIVVEATRADITEALRPTVETLGRYVKSGQMTPQDFWKNVAQKLESLSREKNVSAAVVTELLNREIRTFVESQGAVNAVAAKSVEVLARVVFASFGFASKNPQSGTYAVSLTGQENLQELAAMAKTIAQQLAGEGNTLLISTTDAKIRRNFDEQLRRLNISDLYKVPVAGEKRINADIYLGEQTTIPVIYDAMGRPMNEGLTGIGAERVAQDQILTPSDLALLQLSRTLLQFAAARHVAFAEPGTLSLNQLLKAGLLKEMALDSAEVKDVFKADGQGLAVSENAVLGLLQMITSEMKARSEVRRAA